MKATGVSASWYFTFLKSDVDEIDADDVKMMIWTTFKEKKYLSPKPNVWSIQKIDFETKIADIENKIPSTTNLLVMIRKIKWRKTKFQMLMTW